MMKLLVILLLSLISLKADSNTNQSKNTITMGLGLYLQTQPYANVDTILVPSPVVFYDNNIFYVRWSRVGIYFLGQSSETFSWGASLTIQPRAHGYKPQSGSSVEGMKERLSSFEGGLALAAKYNVNQKISLFGEAVNLHDMLQRNNGYIIRAEIGANIKMNSWGFYPSLLAIHHSSNFNNYYFGIEKNEEIRTIRKSHQVKAGIDYALQTFINYKVNSHYALLLNIRADKLAKEITSSPIVTKNYYSSALISLLYTFNN